MRTLPLTAFAALVALAALTAAPASADTKLGTFPGLGIEATDGSLVRLWDKTASGNFCHMAKFVQTNKTEQQLYVREGEIKSLSFADVGCRKGHLYLLYLDKGWKVLP